MIHELYTLHKTCANDCRKVRVHNFVYSNLLYSITEHYCQSIWSIHTIVSEREVSLLEL